MAKTTVGTAVVLGIVAAFLGGSAGANVNIKGVEWLASLLTGLLGAILGAIIGASVDICTTVDNHHKRISG